MPQMYPLNWIILFIVFTMVFTFFNIIFFYNNLNNLENKNFKLNTLNNKKYWKW